MQITEAMIEATAVRLLKCASATVTSYRVRGDDAQWFALAVRQVEGGDWEQLGRRPSKTELLEFVENRAAQESTAPVGTR